jgi:hypothetical protein
MDDCCRPRLTVLVIQLRYKHALKLSYHFLTRPHSIWRYWRFMTEAGLLISDARKIRGAAMTGRSNRALAAAPWLRSCLTLNAKERACLCPICPPRTPVLKDTLTLLSFLAHQDIVYRLSLPHSLARLQRLLRQPH